ncbi:MAG: hypothetical protein WCK48_04065 [bacterium]
MKHFVLFRYGVISYSPNYGTAEGYVPIAVIPAENYESARDIVWSMFPRPLEQVNFVPADICRHWLLIETPLVKSAEDKSLVYAEDGI